jgi:hypothetical protein
MMHAGSTALDHLANLLDDLRQLPALKEKSRGVFYRGSKPFLHFHEDPTGLFADLRRGALFERFPVSTASDRAEFLSLVRLALSEG